jgi:mono/diheme cytochrome c family protein
MTPRSAALPTLALSLALPVAAALAQAPERPGDAGRGGQIAQERCASCHVVAPGQPTPANAAPPNFADLAKEEDGNDLKILEALEEARHPAIPGGALQRQDLRDVVAYIRTLDTAP